MKRANWVRLIAMILVISMLAAPVSAATFGGSGHSTNGLIGSIIGIIKDIIIEIIDDWFDIPGVGDPDPTEPPVPTTPEEPTAPSEPVVTDPTEPEVTEPEETEPEVTEPVETEPAMETVLELVEDYSTVENGHLLRGTTYTLSQIVAQQPQTAPYALRSSPVSTFAVNSAAATAETITTISVDPLVITTDELGAVIPDGRYVIRYNHSSNGSYMTNTKKNNSPWNTSVLLGTTDKNSATHFTFTRQTDGSYAIQGPAGNYLSISRNAAAITGTPTYFTVEIKNDGIWLRETDNNECINALGASTYSEKYFGGFSEGSPLVLYAVTDGAPELPSTSKVVYFPVTMFNYDTDKLNEATIKKELENKELENPPADHIFQGIYFSSGSPTSYVHNTGTETTKTVVTYSLIDPEFDDEGNISNLDANSEYILVNKRQHTPVIDNGSSLNQGSAIAGAGSESPITLEFAEGQTITELGGGSIWKYSTYTAWDWDSFSYKTYPCIKNASGSYLSFGNDTGSVSGTQVATYIQEWAKDSNCVVIKQGNSYLSNLYGGNTNPFKGYGDPDDDGNPFYIYKKVSTESVTTPNTITYTYAGHNHFDKRSGDPANGDLVWTGMAANQLDDNNIVFNHPEGGIFSYDPSKINAENGYFDGVKNVYEFVGMPFVLSDGIYTFDSDQNGVYFKDTDGDTYSDPAPGPSREAPNNLKFDYGVPQPLRQTGGVADRSTNGWFPYNIYTTRTENGVTKTEYGMQDPEQYNDPNVDYHFGMRADLPFSMTPNGRVKSNDNSSPAITFNFSGDDDVWIYIDGQLVVDLGGMHNRLDIEINFAENTVTYSEHTIADSNDTTGSYNDPENWSDVRKLFNESEGDGLGLINMTRAEFAIDHHHTIQFFYLERGKGTSNCKIEFNLPMLDTVMVSKNISRSWSAEQARQDAIDGEGDGTSPLTAQEKAALANKNFYFTLYRKTANNPTPVAVANTNYYLLDAEGNVEKIPSTGPDGKFYLKNGQTAKFVTDFPSDGITYFVVEDELPTGYLTPDFTFAGESAYGFDYTGVTLDANGKTVTVSDHVTDASKIPEQEIPLKTESKSFEVTATGSVEAIESLHFICENYLDKDLPNPSALAEEDIIVIDYGLPVHIDPLHNDVFRGESIEIVHYTVGDVNFTDEEGKISKEKGDELVNADKNLTGIFGNFEFHPKTYKATLNDEGEITSVVRDTFSYTLNKQLTEVEVLTYVIRVTGTTDTDYCYGQAKLYIAPATIMYYEENFSDMVTFKNNAKYEDAKWGETILTSGHSDYQEDGVVGDSRNHTYGTDEAYLYDSFDSNGTSRYGDTTDGAIQFSYTFTGTGTSIFARTSASTGYMQVKLYRLDEEGNVRLDEKGNEILEDLTYRDTYWKDDNGTTLDSGGTLYNIPVYSTNENLDYGTYKVVCTIAKAGTHTAGNDKGAGNEFYLDGIRILRPLNKNAERQDLVNRAIEAYATDGESNLNVVTLRQKLITDNYFPVDPESGELEEEWPFVVLTDIDGTITYASDYVSIGPKEEVYLMPGQKVTFSLKYWEPEGLKLYAGMKAPFGDASLDVGRTPFRLQNTVDSYYDVTGNYADLFTDEEQLRTKDGMYVYTDPQGNTVYEKCITGTEESIFYDESGNVIEVNYDDLTAVMREYHVVTYTFEATDKIVSLTNIKVVGNYTITIVEKENEDEEVPGTDPVDGEAAEEEGNE